MKLLEAWPDQLADALTGLALQLQPALGASLIATLRRCVAQLEAEREAGHVCLPLSAVDAARLRATGLVMGAPADGRPLVIDGEPAQPLLYLQRDHDHERALAATIARLSAEAPRPIPTEPLRGLFPGQDLDGPVDWQAVAVAQALRQRLTLISGGPGTGKTSTVVTLLACALAHQPDARIALAAPTGKAAQRMLEALREGAERLGLQGLPLPQEALTVHRLLGLSPQGLRHGVENPLALDWLIVDEASMLDLERARQLFDALGPDTRLVLLGDRHQLAAVENGAVFAELSRHPGWRADTAAQLAGALGRPLPLPPPGPLPDLAVPFTQSHRFRADSGIGRLAAQVREGDAAAVRALLQAGEATDLHWRPDCPEAELDALLRAGFGDYFSALQGGDEAAIWRAWESFRVLCAGHGGPWGTRAINQRGAALLAAALPPGVPAQLGQPLLVTRNQGPFTNGDVLLLLPAASGTGLEAVLRRGPGESLRFAPERLPLDLDGAFALTVHKAQGSEFDRALLLLPPVHGQPPSREWLYTGATRAKQQLVLVADAASLGAVVHNPTARRSGLAARLAEAPLA